MKQAEAGHARATHHRRPTIRRSAPAVHQGIRPCEPIRGTATDAFRPEPDCAPSSRPGEATQSRGRHSHLAVHRDQGRTKLHRLNAS